MSKILAVFFALVLSCTVAFGQHENTTVGDKIATAVSRADANTDGIHTFNMVTVTARHADGTLFYTHTSHNLKTTVGIDAIASQVANTSTQAAAGNYIALSSAIGTPAIGDTVVANEITTNGGGRAQATYAHTAGTSTYTLAHTWTATGTIAAINGAGVLNAASVGTDIFENTFTSVALNTGDQITVTWTITIS